MFHIRFKLRNSEHPRFGGNQIDHVEIIHLKNKTLNEMPKKKNNEIRQIFPEYHRINAIVKKLI